MTIIHQNLWLGKLVPEGLDGGGGLEFSNQKKISPLFSFFKSFAYSLKKINYVLKCQYFISLNMCVLFILYIIKLLQSNCLVASQSSY